MTDMHPDLRAALASLSRALTSLGRSLRAIDQHQQREAGAQEERDERTEKLVEALNETIEALPGRIEAAVAAGVRAALLEREPGPVERAKQDLAVEVIRAPIGAFAWVRGGVRAVSRWPRELLGWARANPAVAGALATSTATAVGGFLLQIAEGSPILVALGRAIAAFGGEAPSAGGAP